MPSLGDMPSVMELTSSPTVAGRRSWEPVGEATPSTLCIALQFEGN